jgi:hypothetical protein
MRRVRRSKLVCCGLMSLVVHGAVAALMATAALGLPVRPGDTPTSQVPTFVELRDSPVPDPVAPAGEARVAPATRPGRSGRRVASAVRRHRPADVPLVPPSARLRPELADAATRPERGPAPVEVPAAAPDPAIAGALPAAAAAPVPATALSPSPEPRWLTATDARYLRIRDSFPGLPANLRSGPGPYVVLTRICVGAGGQVTSVGIEQGADPTLDAAIAAAVRGWLYRPLVVAGVPRSFCHLMRFNYTLG